MFELRDDIKKLLRKLTADAERTGGEDISSKIYRDVPLPLNGAETANAAPSQYRAMRKMAHGSAYYDSSVKIFYKQAKFMEDFEDEFDYEGEFLRYFPTYQSMNEAQLRGYFSWRTKTRRGEIEKTSLSFVFVYLYELLNQIGVCSAEEGFHKLKDFWTAYREIDGKINHYMRLWLKDYVVYHNLDKTLLDDFSDVHFDRSVLILLHHRAHEADEVFSALCSMSSYHIERTGFFKQYPDDVTHVASGVFASLSEYCDKNRKMGAHEKFFGKLYAHPYTMFKSALFYEASKRKEYLYEINDIYRFRCREGAWSCERFFGYKGKMQQIGALLKSIDFFMRRAYGFKSALKLDKTTKIYHDIIHKEIEKYQETKRKKARMEITINVSKLPLIREAALETQNRLIVEDSEQVQASDILDETVVPETGAGLSGVEYEFMRLLLYGGPYAEFAHSKGLLISVLADAVNKKLFDLFGDAVILYEGDVPVLVQDYTEELRGIIGE